MIVKQKNNVDLVGKKAIISIGKAGLKKGDKITITQIGLGHPDYFYANETGVQGHWTNNELTLCPETIDEFLNEIKVLESKVSDLKTKIKVMKSLGLKEYDDDYIKVYSALELIESSKSKAEKALAISKLIKGSL